MVVLSATGMANMLDAAQGLSDKPSICLPARNKIEPLSPRR